MDPTLSHQDPEFVHTSACTCPTCMGVTTETTTTAQGATRTDVYRDGVLIGFVGRLDSGFVAFSGARLGEFERLGAFTDAADAIAAVKAA